MKPPPPQPAPTFALTLLGAGGHARVVASSARRAGLRVAAVLDVDPGRIGAAFGDLVIQAESEAAPGPFHAAVGANRVRRAMVEARPDACWRRTRCRCGWRCT